MDARERRQAIAAMHDDEFELLVHELVVAEHADDDLKVRKMAAPDGGADTLVLEAEDRVLEVVQAKHYTAGISWKKCEKSLDRAVATWSPKKVTFAFPVNWTESRQTSFAKRLANRHPGIDVEPITLADIERLLDEHPEVGPRFFGPEARTIEEVVERASKLGGQRLQTGRDLIARAEELGDFGDELDPHYQYATSTGSIETPQPNWEQVPVMRIEAIQDRSRVTIGAFEREYGTSQTLLAFTEDEDGRQLKERARRELAAGRSVEFTRGIRALMSPPPKILEDLDAPSVGDLVMTIRAADPVDVEMRIETAAGELQHRFRVRSIPPKEAGHHAFASLADGLWIEIDLNLPGEPQVEMNFTMSAEFGRDATTNAAAAEFLLAYLHHTQIRFSGRPLFPDEGIAAQVPVPEFSPELESEISLRRDLYSDLAFIEDQLGVALPIPDSIHRDALNTIGTVSEILRSGEGTATFSEARKMVPASELAQFPDVFPPHTREIQVTYTLWGHVLDLGTAEYTIPEMTVKSIRPVMPTPDSPAEVLIGPADSDQATFRLIDRRERARTASGGVLL